VLEDKGGYGPGSAYLFGSGFGSNTVSFFTGFMPSGTEVQHPGQPVRMTDGSWVQSGSSISVVGGGGGTLFDALASTIFVGNLLKPKAVDSWRRLEASLNVAPQSGADYSTKHPYLASDGVMTTASKGLQKRGDTWLKKSAKKLFFAYWLNGRGGKASVVDGKIRRDPPGQAMNKTVVDAITPVAPPGGGAPAHRGGARVRGWWFFSLIAAPAAFQTGCAAHGCGIGAVDAGMTAVGAPITFTEMWQQAELAPAYESAVNLGRAGVSPSSGTWGPAMAHTMGRW
jgi:hypothetical protein